VTVTQTHDHFARDPRHTPAVDEAVPWWRGVATHRPDGAIAALTPFLLVLGPLALLVAMGIVFAETGLLIGFFLPGDSLLFTLGVLSAGGLLHLPFWLVAVGLLLAAVAGDQVGYLLGRRFGPRVFSRTESRFFSRAHAERAQAFFAKHGPKAVVLAR